MTSKGKTWSRDTNSRLPFAVNVKPGLKCSYAKNFQPAYQDLGWKNGGLGNRASPPSSIKTSKILQRI